ncbi:MULTISPECIES: hypothetical protein [unclassified Pseudomonas]|uniref:hypothetical protein n=1 Tax=unclassified Pseudomonas TaxID=196821 RepID=UPI00114D089F|nr:MULTISPECIES: hypothetical protein [unclassified Pseudomonas]QIH07409.1 hypothetical protein ATY02_12090 [Pseudomonas sp. BIOMIG1BAC]QIH11151.1 hypothetical protein ATY02_32675 [Pseudomonas sp. BIOMIG1BAC]
MTEGNYQLKLSKSFDDDLTLVDGQTQSFPLSIFSVGPEASCDFDDVANSIKNNSNSRKHQRNRPKKAGLCRKKIRQKSQKVGEQMGELQIS